MALNRKDRTLRPWEELCVPRAHIVMYYYYHHFCKTIERENYHSDTRL